MVEKKIALLDNTCMLVGEFSADLLKSHAKKYWLLTD